MPASSSELLHYKTHLFDVSADWLVFIHGVGGSTVTWKRQVPVLSKSFNLLLVDLPGHGVMANKPNEDTSYSFESVGLRIWDVIFSLKLKRVHLIGISLGTIIALSMREQHPHKVVSLVNGGAILRLNTKLKVLARLSLGLAKIIGYPAFYRLSANIMMPRKNHQKSRDIFIRESRFLSTEEFRKWTAMYRGLNDTLSRLFQAESNTPHLIVMGEQDHLFLGQAKLYAKMHKSVQLEILAGCGHVVTIEKADLFNAFCLEFLRNIYSKA